MRVVTLLGVIAATLALVFHLVHIAPDYDFTILALGTIAIGIGNLTGL